MNTTRAKGGTQWHILGIIFVALASPVICCLSWGEVRWWVAPPSCAETADMLGAALDVSLQQRDWAGDSPDRIALERLRIAENDVDKSSRAAVAAWGRLAADVTPTVRASSIEVSRVEEVGRRGADVVRACE